MKREYLAELGLDKEVIDKIMSEHGKTVNDTKTTLTASQEEATALKEQLAQRDNDMKELKKSTGANDELKKQFDDLQTKYNDEKTALENTLASTRKDSAIELALVNAKARNTKAVKALLDADKLELSEDGLKGLNDQLEAIKKDNSFMFEDDTTLAPIEPATPPIFTGGNFQSGVGGETDAFKAAAQKYI